MKKYLLSCCLTLSAMSIFAQAPCVPGTVSLPQSGYIIPDSATNFKTACVGQYYEQIIYIKAPKDTLVSSVPAVVDSFVVNKNVMGVPAGLTVEAVPGFNPAAAPNPKTNFERLIIKGDSIACIKISGITNVAPGPYNLTIEVRAYLRISGIIPMDTTSNIGYYKIQVQGSPCWPAAVSNLSAYGFDLVGNHPNPFSGSTQISFESGHNDNYTIKVMNLLGEEVYHANINGKMGLNYHTINATTWSSGIYMYTINNGKNQLSAKLQVIK